MAEQVTYWEAEDGSLHKKEIDATEADVIHYGGDESYYDMIVKRLENSDGSIIFRHDGIPSRIAYRLMYSGYIGQLHTPYSNADSPHQYTMIFYKKGVQPTRQLNMVIQHEKKEEYKHFKELYGPKEPKTLRETITKSSRSNCDYEDEKFEFTEAYLDTELSKMTILTKNFGEYSILYHRDNYFLFSGNEMKYHVSLYESHGHNLNSEKGLFIIYGHEQIVCLFNDGTSKEIRTR